ncbi:hypothetical protein PsYK624_125820 [Phanerochaete sordida]|uniref:Uncharacterized protein n=1 Tax=Phanerochaete sordida TaxID=48140 RepID=A0A9P3LIC1_9APHY|nr:hypothetical protein PsYK624_125820 [Phanerochaete sordida]
MSFSTSTGNSSTPDLESWHSDPSFRGTWGIIATCLSTLIICVWSAIHVDIAPHHRNRSFFDKVWWLIVGLLAPDWLLLVAFRQLYWAWDLSYNAKKYFLVQEPAGPSLSWLQRLKKRARLGARQVVPSSWSERREEERILLAETGYGAHTGMPSTANTSNVRQNVWTMTHSYYAAMGGLVLDASLTPVFGTEVRLVLSPTILHFLMERVPDIIPDFPIDRIQCWSRSDGLAKLLLVVQLLYFTISCAARLAQNLPLSLLEVWTLAHALGAILVYIAWWRKPLDIAEPTLLAGDRARELAAYFQVVGIPLWPRAAGVDNHYGTPEANYLQITPCRTMDDCAFLYKGQNSVTLYPGQTVQVEGYAFTLGARIPDVINSIIFGGARPPWYARERNPDGSVVLGTGDLVRWQLAARAATRLGGLWQPPNAIIYTQSGGLETFDVVPASGSSFSPALGTIVVPIMTVYALPHFLGWNAAFPTPLERTLWRFASVMIAVLPTVFYVCFVFKLIGRRTKPFAYTIAGMLLRVVLIATGALFWTAIILYILANGYLLVDSLKQLSHLPDDAFLLPDLSVYLPHFT